MLAHNHERKMAYELPQNATHYVFGKPTGIYYKVDDKWFHQGDEGNSFEVRYMDVDEYSTYFNQEIHEVNDFTHDKPVTEVSIDNECKERVGQVFGSFPIGKQFISSGFIKKSDLMIGSGWRIGDGDGFASRFVIAHTKTDLDLLSEFAPDFTKHKDCDIAVIRDIVEQYRNKIKQLQESKK